MKNWILSILVCAAAALLMACPGKDAPHRNQDRTLDDGLERMNRSNKIRAAAINYPPSMIIAPNGSYRSGIMHDVMAKIVGTLSVEIEYVEQTTWANMIEAVENNRVDVVVSGIWPSGERARRADFTSAVYYSPVYAYVRGNDQRLDDGLDRIETAGTRIATIDGELSAAIALSDFPAAETVSLPDTADVSQLLLQLTTRKADVTFVEGAIAAEFLAKNPGTIRRVGGVDAIRSFPNTFLVKKGDRLKGVLDVAISELHRTRAISKILDAYDPSGFSFIRPEVPGLAPAASDPRP